MYMLKLNDPRFCFDKYLISFCEGVSNASPKMEELFFKPANASLFSITVPKTKI